LYSQTNSDGRCPTLLPEGYKAEKGIYRVTFETQAFFSKIGQECFYPYVQVNIYVFALKIHASNEVLLDRF
jgi:5-hydroxyisourate hydrolase-like protein (transthyretin family)